VRVRTELAEFQRLAATCSAQMRAHAQAEEEEEEEKE
jgi:hypothetical protein